MKQAANDRRGQRTGQKKYNSRGAARPAARRGSASRTNQAKRARARRGKQSGAYGVAALVLLMVLICFGAVCAWRYSEYQQFKVMKNAVATQNFYGGTAVDGIDVARMTLGEAVDYWENQIEPQYRLATVTVTDGTAEINVTAEQLGYESDYAQVLSDAWSAGRSGSLKERYMQLINRAGSTNDRTVTRRMYSDEAVRAYVDALAAQIDTEAVSAEIRTFNTETYEFEFESGRNGRVLDREKLVEDIEAALDALGGTVNLRIDTIAPEVEAEDISAQYGLIAYAITNASSSSSNRLENIRLALSMLNGTCLEAGETFSFNEAVGQRTEARGFKVATAYSSGEVTEQVGGGICQVSTTLFNAAVKADLQIDERHAHSLTVSYVDLGKDAAVDWGNKDLKFTNTSTDRVYICCYLTEDKRIRFGIFGKLLPNGETITVEGEQTGVIDYDTQYQLNFSMASGVQNVLQKGKKGYTAITYKVRHDASGNETGREVLCKSRYSAVNQIIEYGQ